MGYENINRIGMTSLCHLQLAYDQMQSLGANIEFEYDRTDICRECVWAEVKCKRRFFSFVAKRLAS